jgi:hypothetical protein
METKTGKTYEWWYLSLEDIDVLEANAKQVSEKDCEWDGPWRPDLDADHMVRDLFCRGIWANLQIAHKKGGGGPFRAAVDLGDTGDKGKSIILILPKSYNLWNKAYGAATTAMRGWVAFDDKNVREAA